MHEIREVFDISVTLGQEAVVYPGDPEFSLEVLSSLSEGASAQVSRFSMCAHSGTHLELPAHFLAGADTIEKYPAKSFILSAQVVQIENSEAVERRELSTKEIKTGRALLFKTRNSASDLVRAGRFCEDYVYIAPDAALFCLEKQARLVGLDYCSIDRFGAAKDYPAHKILLNKGLLILEGINLKEVPEGDYSLVCLPLKIKGAEASPVRAVLIR